MGSQVKEFAKQSTFNVTENSLIKHILPNTIANLQGELNERGVLLNFDLKQWGVKIFHSFLNVSYIKIPYSLVFIKYMKTRNYFIKILIC